MKEKSKTKLCLDCRKEFPREKLSRRGLCAECGYKRMVRAVEITVEAHRK